ncbi:MAG: MerR family transcriptional regulator [Actinobacteria bacterium]|nr:MerR family transcriptional regulator [Actinomycetota bacterium]
MRIGELAATADTTTKTLRFYEERGLLPAPRRTASGYRDYPASMVNRVGFIRAAQASGLTLAQIGEILAIRDEDRPPCTHVVALVDQRLADVEDALAQLLSVREELRGLRTRAVALDPADCAPGNICAAVTGQD